MPSWELDPARPRPPIIERAYQLADTGEFQNVEEIIDQLLAERYEGESVYLNFESRAATRSDAISAERPDDN
jgi:hypothetical protein